MSYSLIEAVFPGEEIKYQSRLTRGYKWANVWHAPLGSHLFAAEGYVSQMRACFFYYPFDQMMNVYCSETP